MEDLICFLTLATLVALFVIFRHKLRKNSGDGGFIPWTGDSSDGSNHHHGGSGHHGHSDGGGHSGGGHGGGDCGGGGHGGH